MTNKSHSGQAKRPVANNDSFLEALRGLGSGGIKKGLPRSGEMTPGQDLDFDNFQEQQEKLENQRRFFHQDYLNLRRREEVIWTKQEQEVKLQVKAILSELKQIAASTKDLTKEITFAAAQTPVEAGVYHLNFFEKLRLALIELKKRVEESATWLAAFNQKSKKRNYYWNQFKKSGTKFTLSADRYMSTQVG
ncbi:MAG: DUF5660 family protein [Candidatus Shapirobacteria bacterium]